MPRNPKSLILSDFHSFGNYMYNLNNNANLNMQPPPELNDVEQKECVENPTQYSQLPKTGTPTHYGIPYSPTDRGTSVLNTKHPVPQPSVTTDNQACVVNSIQSSVTDLKINENLRERKSASINEGVSNIRQDSRKRKAPVADTHSLLQNSKKKKG